VSRRVLEAAKYDLEFSGYASFLVVLSSSDGCMGKDDDAVGGGGSRRPTGSVSGKVHDEFHKYHLLPICLLL